MLLEAIKKELSEWKYHIFGIISFLIKYIVPVAFVLSKSMTTKETQNAPAIWGIFVLIILALIYYGILRRVLTNKRTEESLVARLKISKIKPLRIILFTTLDEIIVMPMIPFVLWLVCDLLQQLCVNISLSFLAIGIMFVIGGILKLIDVVVNLNRLLKEGD